jgi:hypothetical protein
LRELWNFKGDSLDSSSRLSQFQVSHTSSASQGQPRADPEGYDQFAVLDVIAIVPQDRGHSHSDAIEIVPSNINLHDTKPGEETASITTEAHEICYVPRGSFQSHADIIEIIPSNLNLQHFGIGEGHDNAFDASCLAHFYLAA